MGDELVDFLEAAGVEEQIDPLAGGELAGVMMTAQPLVPAPFLRAALQIL
jgi:hypothetical protein